jgi:hypothetical protein
MKKLFYLPLIILALALSACSVVRGSGDVITETRQVSGFDKVLLAGSGEVILTQGDEESLKVEAEDNLMPYLDTEVRNGTLVLGPQEDFLTVSLWPTRPIKYYVTVIDIEAVTLAGSGSISTDKVDVSRLDVNLYGSGDIKLDEVLADKVDVSLTGSGSIQIGTLTAIEVSTTISGSGKCEIEGEATQQQLRITGSGDYDAPDLESQTADITVSGSGNSTVWVTESLEVRITGSGNVRYFGSPDVSDQITGSGNVSGRRKP